TAVVLFFFFPSRRRHTRCYRDWSSDVCSSDLLVLILDDLQWSDADSLAMLRELSRPPHAPSLLLLATVRAAAETSLTERVSVARSEERRVGRGGGSELGREGGGEVRGEQHEVT